MAHHLLIPALLFCSVWGVSYLHPCPPRKHVENEFDAMMSLKRLGYLVSVPGGSAELTDEVWAFSVAAFQRMAAINVTGTLDAPTMEMLNKPRCGVPDIMPGQQNDVFGDTVSRKRRYSVSEDKWTKTELTYRITQYTPDLPESTVNSIITQAFNKWSEVTPLTFVLRPRGPVDLEIKFAKQIHGDDVPFDGAGGTLAHAFFPPASMWSPDIAGDTHFDDDETWIEINTETKGTPLLCVAIHEIGHSLGIHHSNNEDAIMWPWARECTEQTGLSQDDIDAVQHLYGSREGTMNTTSTPTPGDTTAVMDANTADVSTANPTSDVMTSTQTMTSSPVTSDNVTPEETPMSTGSPCDGNVDAMTSAADGHMYGFRGEQVFRFGEGVDVGFPKPIGDVFPGAPSHVTAAMTSYKHQGRHHHRRHGRHGRHGHDRNRAEATYIFNNDQVWKYKFDHRHGFRLQKRFPRYVSHVFYGVTATTIDGATMLATNGDIYLFSGDQYWRHNGEGKKLAARTYPRPWSTHPIFSALPSIDAALLYKDKNYFFAGQEFFSYDSSRRRMSLPRDTAHHILRCPEEQGHHVSQLADFWNSD